MSYVPDDGDIIEIDLEDDQSQASVRRLVLVLSPRAFHEAFGLAWVVPITFIKSRHLFQIDLPESLKTFGTVKIEQLFTVDYKARRGAKVESVPAAFLGRCRTAAGRVLGF